MVFAPISPAWVVVEPLPIHEPDLFAQMGVNKGQIRLDLCIRQATEREHHRLRLRPVCVGVDKQRAAPRLPADTVER